MHGCGRVLKLAFNRTTEKIIGTAKPKAHELEEYKLSWALSTGDTLVVSRPMGALDWERHLEFFLKTPDANAGLVSLPVHVQLGDPVEFLNKRSDLGLDVSVYYCYSR